MRLSLVYFKLAECSFDYAQEDFACALACRATEGCESSDCVDDVCEGIYWDGNVERRDFVYVSNITDPAAALPCAAAVEIAVKENWRVYNRTEPEAAVIFENVAIASDFGVFLPVDSLEETQTPSVAIWKSIRTWLSLT